MPVGGQGVNRASGSGSGSRYRVALRRWPMSFDYLPGSEVRYALRLGVAKRLRQQLAGRHRGPAPSAPRASGRRGSAADRRNVKALGLKRSVCNGEASCAALCRVSRSAGTGDARRAALRCVSPRLGLRRGAPAASSTLRWRSGRMRATARMKPKMPTEDAEYPRYGRGTSLPTSLQDQGGP